jgi:hypothetical protein
MVLRDPRGRTLWSRSVAVAAGSNSISLPVAGDGVSILEVERNGHVDAVKLPGI